MTTFRTTLRQLAGEQDGDERLRLSNLFASELELAFNQQSDQAQKAISDTEEVLLTRIDRLHTSIDRLNAALSDANTLVTTALEVFTRLDAVSKAQIGQIQDLFDADAAINGRLDYKRQRLDNHEARLNRIEQHLGLADDGVKQ